MTAEHKAALAEGRAESRVVKAYLEALDQNRPKRGRRRTKDGIQKRLEQVETELESANSLKRLSLLQERIDLRNEISTPEKVVDISAAEAGFIRVAKSYSARKNLTYSAWREFGVTAAVLQKAGISRGS